MRERRFVKSLQHHDKLLTFVGALIVFATFVVDQELMEQWRGTADAVENASRQAMMMSDIQEVKVSEKKVTDILLSLDGQFGLINVKNHEFDYELEVLGAEETDVNIQQERLQIRTDLEQHLPKDRLWLQQVETEKDLLRRLEKETQIRRERLFSSDRGELSAFLDGSSDFEIAIDTESQTEKVNFNRVLMSARKTTQSNRQKATIARLVTIMLFVLGWGLGLLGKTAGLGD